MGYHTDATISQFSVKEVQGNVGTMTSMGTENLTYSSVLPDQSFLTGVNSAYNYLDFDGSDAKVDLGSPSSLQIASATYACWIYWDGDSMDTIFGRYGSISYDIRWRIESSSKLKLYSGGVWRDETTTVTASQWQHIAITIDSTACKTYVDGVETNSSAGFSISTSAEPNTIGFHALQSHYFGGNITGFGIWNKSLSGTDISAIHKAGRHSNLLDSYSDNLVGYYAFGGLDAITGLADTNSTIYDRSGNGNHGTPSGTASGDLKSPPNAEPEGYDIESTTRTTTTP